MKKLIVLSLLAMALIACASTKLVPLDLCFASPQNMNNAIQCTNQKYITKTAP